MLETKDHEYVMASVRRKGCMNSALLTEELVGFMLATYPSRFTVAEHTDVSSVVLLETHATIHAGAHEVKANKVILATNGFEKFSIRNDVGEDINVAFHQIVEGLIGYMAGYLEPIGKPPIAIAYHDDLQKALGIRGEDPYFYLTRRPYEMENNERHNLVCVGGPEEKIADTTHYARDKEYPAHAREMITEFLISTYAHAPEDTIKYAFSWHGLMAYTPNGIRLVGVEPRNSVLLYNLGCNGLGLIPSIAGGFRIARILRGDVLPPSIFDPKNQQS
jgi:glycine/D-amino acid oxidase-like deaminating enzyme